MCSSDPDCPENAFCKSASYCVCHDNFVYAAINATYKGCLKGKLSKLYRTGGKPIAESLALSSFRISQYSCYVISPNFILPVFFVDGFLIIFILNFSEARSGDPCTQHIQCQSTLGIHSECNADICVCKNTAHLNGDRCFETAGQF